MLKEGDCVLFDMGCVKDRYCSDMTRTWFCGQPTEKQAAVHDLVRRANEAAEALIKPGVKLCDLDAAARDLITEAGYGEYFNHRLATSSARPTTRRAMSAVPTGPRCARA